MDYGSDRSKIHVHRLPVRELASIYLVRLPTASPGGAITGLATCIGSLIIWTYLDTLSIPHRSGFLMC